MSDQDMINAIVTSIQTQANLILLLQTMISNNIQIQPTLKLQSICTILGIDFTQGAP